MQREQQQQNSQYQPHVTQLSPQQQQEQNQMLQQKLLELSADGSSDQSQRPSLLSRLSSSLTSILPKSMMNGYEQQEGGGMQQQQQQQGQEPYSTGKRKRGQSLGPDSSGPSKRSNFKVETH